MQISSVPSDRIYRHRFLFSDDSNSSAPSHMTKPRTNCNAMRKSQSSTVVNSNSLKILLQQFKRTSAMGFLFFPISLNPIGNITVFRAYRANFTRDILLYNLLKEKTILSALLSEHTIPILVTTKTLICSQ